MSSCQDTRDIAATETASAFKKPMNAFFVFRRNVVRNAQFPPDTKQQDVSRYAAHLWEELSAARKDEYYKLADLEKKKGPRPKEPKKRTRSKAKAKSTAYSTKRDARPEIRVLDFSARCQNHLLDNSQYSGPSDINSLPHYPTLRFVDETNKYQVLYGEPSGSSSTIRSLPAPQQVHPLPSGTPSDDVWSQTGPYTDVDLPLSTREPTPPPIHQIHDEPSHVSVEDMDYETFSRLYPLPEGICTYGLLDDIGEAWTSLL